MKHTKKDILKYFKYTYISLFFLLNFFLSVQSVPNLMAYSGVDEKIVKCADSFLSFMRTYREQEKIDHHLLNEFVIHCEKYLASESECTIDDLFTKVFDTITYDEFIKALRPDASYGSNGSPVGSLTSFECTNGQILSFINKLRFFFQQCCALIQRDFNGTFTTLSMLIDDFAGTFTVYNDILVTLTTDFAGTFTALDACCEAEEVDFTELFTVLSATQEILTTEFIALFTTLNEFCEAQENDLIGITTVLTGINEVLATNFNGTFTLFDVILKDFNSTFTLLQEFESTLTEGFNGTFTALSVCCGQFMSDFNGIFTSLNTLEEIIAIDFNGVATTIGVLNQQLDSTFTMLAVIQETIITDFSEIFTQLNACCENQAEDFGGVFTTISIIEQEFATDLSGLFTALNACCRDKSADFSGVFTLLSATEQIIAQDFSGIFTILNALEDDFSTIFTVVDEVQANFITQINGTFTELSACCQSISIDFSGIFTTLAEIKETLTDGFSGTFTALDAGCQIITVDLNNIFTSLYTTNDIVETNFEGTFTVIASIQDSLCNPISIMEPMIITVPGYYCLATDLMGTLTIASNNVTVNLNHQVIQAINQVGIYVDNGANVVITNGAFKSNAVAIEIVATNTITLRNLIIEDCSDTGILVNSGCVGVIIRDVVIDTVTNHGINFIGQTDAVRCQRVNLSNFGGTFGIGTVGSLSDSLFESCQIVSSSMMLTTCTAFMMAQGNNNQCIDCIVSDIQNSGGTVLAFSIGSDATTLENCTTMSLLSSIASEGYYLSGQGIALESCYVLGLQSDTASYGFIISGSAIVLNNCFVESSTTVIGAVDGAGFFVIGSEAEFLNCQSFGMHSGFSVESTSFNSSLLTCVAAINSADGFLLNNETTIVGYCTSFNNVGFGFNSASSVLPIYGCFASGNTGGNYSPAIPFVQPASQNTNVFARGNNYI